MYTFVLIIVFLNGYGPRATVQFQEFTTKERCESAATEVRNLWAKSRDAANLNGVLCIQK